MKPLCLLIAALLLATFQLSAQTWQWTHPEPNGTEITYNNDPYAYEDDKVHDIETDAAGNIYVLGNFQDSLYLSDVFITKNNGSYLAKYDSTGILLWRKLIVPTTPADQYGVPRIYATDLTVNANGVFVTGKYDHSLYQNDYDCSKGTGTFTLRSYNIGGFTLNSSGTDIGLFITKFNSNGTFVWNKTAKDPYFCDKDGNPNWPFQVTYNPMITSDNAGNIVCSFVCSSIKGSFLINNDAIPLRAVDAGTPTYPTYLVVAKYNSAGALQWSANAGGGFNALNASSSAYLGYMQDCGSIISDKNNNIFFLGSATDSTFFGSQLFRINGTNGTSTFVSKISSAGVWQFAKELTDNPDIHSNGSIENPENLAVDSSNNVYAVVPYSGNPQVILGTPVAGGTSNYLVKMKNNGSRTWIKPFGSNFGNTYHHSIHYNNGSLYFCGEYFAYYSNTDQKLVFSQLYTPWAGGGTGTFLFYAAKADLNGNFIWLTTMENGGYSSSGDAIKAINGNIYTGGSYQYKITSLGHLNGNFADPNPSTYNLFLGKLKDQYIKVGAVTPTQLIPGCTITIPFTSTGLTFGNSNTFTAELSDVNGGFTSPTAIGTILSTGSGSITATIPASLNYSSGYRVRIRSSDTLATGLNYYAYADTGYVLSLSCPAPSSGFTATNVAATAATLNWTAVPCAAGYKVQYRVKGTTTWTTKNINSNTPAINLTGLTANTVYQWRVATKCNNNGINSFSAFSAIKQFTTAAAFTAKNAATTKINVDEDLSIFVQPNPAKMNAILMINGGVKNAAVSISDLTGKVLWKTDAVNTNRIMLPVQNLASGIYLITLVNGSKIKVIKLAKE